MNNDLMYKLLKARIKVFEQAEISVAGVSMNPNLFDGDRITVSPCKNYVPGDILIFNYKQEGILVHRLLYIKGEKYFCKGDNSFRLEDINKEQIVGKVILANGNKPAPCTDRLLEFSYLVNREFVKCRYDTQKTKQSDIYQLYKKAILQKEDDIMIYKRNETMDYIQSDKTSLAVFDPDTGDTHFFDETGIDILNLLSEPRDFDSLLEKLCEIYSVTKDEIRTDVEEFLAETVSKKVVEEI
jgi:PqqD family protein of HPr-rel-A system